jgi:hypothetical protein
MKPLPLAGLALSLLFALSSSARAEFIPWMYNWSRSPSEIHSDAPGTGYITLTDESLKGAVGDSDIVATNMRTFSTATALNPDKFTAKNYSLTLFLLDLASGQSGTVTFTGQIDGELGATFSRMQNTFTGASSQFIILGDNRYTASNPTFSPPGIPGAANAGSVSAHVTILVEQVPEPSTLTLTALGTVALGIARRLSRRGRSRSCREREPR